MVTNSALCISLINNLMQVASVPTGMESSGRCTATKYLTGSSLAFTEHLRCYNSLQLGRCFQSSTSSATACVTSMILASLVCSIRCRQLGIYLECDVPRTGLFLSPFLVREELKCRTVLCLVGYFSLKSQGSITIRHRDARLNNTVLHEM